ncbi:fumarate hydratase, alpha subunit [Candidatus Desulfofervidus auxilii]|uniref:Fumarate hydratase, alpha subunit n=1 Tax=Desulfofervidus auxilii TaxID=1621989 RepID=A0A7U4QKL6_DESA2|nr:fumarate hydratase [Candidatus Desulfofervidus auxilii]AMM41074.1 fumarate hydratase, alpha subunit [Candidatus Desulfofervidus auxilii]
MREIAVTEITKLIKRLCIESCISLNEDIIKVIKRAEEKEESEIGKKVIKQLLNNEEVAKKERIPLCQDTGVTLVYLEIGQDVHFIGGDLKRAIQEGVRQGYKEGYLRKSVCHPLSRENTGDNTPAIVHFEIVAGDKVKIMVMPKGAGSENMCTATVLTPAAGLKGIEQFVCQTIERAAVNTCSPLIVGVGIGGTIDKAAFLAKKALLRPIGERARDKTLAKLEEKWLEMFNNLGYGPLGLGGRVTCLDVHIETHPCHIASLPVGVNVQCHAHRLKTIVI